MIRYEIREDEYTNSDTGKTISVYNVYRDKHNTDEWDYYYDELSVWAGMYFSREDAESAIAYLEGV